MGINPKDAVGSSKAPWTCLPLPVIAEVGLAMSEGARKYGRHNYRASKIIASIYIDAAFRHIAQWWEGEDLDKDSGISHITKAIATLVVLRDTMIQGNVEDDRPPKSHLDWMEVINKSQEELVQKYPEPKDKITELDSSSPQDMIEAEYCTGEARRNVVNTCPCKRYKWLDI